MTAQIARPDGATPDRGMSLVEVLIAIILLAIGGTAVMVGLNVSIRGSEGHELRMVALAELSATSSYLATVKVENCGDYAAAVASRPQTLNVPRVSISITGLQCTGDSTVRTITLKASSNDGRADETLTLKHGAPTILYQGQPAAGWGGGGGGGGGGGIQCTWGSVSVTPTEVKLRAQELTQPVSVSVPYTGDCVGRTVVARFVNGSLAADVVVQTMLETNGVFTTTFATGDRNWKKLTNQVEVLANGVLIGSTTVVTT
jgi:prepilin-type N-terminal cleavage/methylation domain-containing protein